MICPGPVDDLGCQAPGTCMPMMGDYPASCPAICGQDERMCPGTMDANGCQFPDMCQPMFFSGNDPRVQCESHCPMDCGPDSMICPGPVDEMGCQAPGTCMPNTEAC